MIAARNAVIAAVTAAGLTGAFTLVDRFEWTGRETTTYVDPVGIRTICRGHTGPLTTKGRATLAECDEATLQDLLTAQKVVRSCTTAPMTPGELNAWTSFAFNVGPGRAGVKDGFCRLKNGRIPTHIAYIESHQPVKACGMLMSWTMPGTSVHNGLKRRREAEMALCLQDLK